MTTNIVQNSFLSNLKANLCEEKQAVALHGLILTVSTLSLSILVANPMTAGIVFAISMLSCATTYCGVSIQKILTQKRKIVQPNESFFSGLIKSVKNNPRQAKIAAAICALWNVTAVAFAYWLPPLNVMNFDPDYIQLKYQMLWLNGMISVLKMDAVSSVITGIAIGALISCRKKLPVKILGGIIAYFTLANIVLMNIR